MKKSLILALSILALFGSAEAQVQGGNILGLEGAWGMRGGSMMETLSITSPYLKMGNGLIAIKASGDLSLAAGQMVGTNAISYSTFWSTRLGFTSKREINDYISTSLDMGGVMLFPSSEISASESLHLGVYADLGVEFYLDSTKRKSLYLSAGYQFLVDPLVADKYAGNDILGTGADVSAGIRFWL
jgi:hypothetical protein